VDFRTTVIKPGSLILDQGDIFADDVFEGLSESQKRISPMYFYDDKGSRIFDEITRLESYYLTRVELQILMDYRRAIAGRLIGEDIQLIELGAGSNEKNLVLLQEFARQDISCTYVPVDISHEAMRSLQVSLEGRVPDRIRIRGYIADYFDAMLRINLNKTKQRNFVLFLGSNIGNFDRASAIRFLGRIWRRLNHGDYLLVGFDLMKDSVQIMTEAYSDHVTARFNMNLLHRMNRELGAQFNTEVFQHYAAFNSRTGCIDSWLVSKRKQSVEIGVLERSFNFEIGEGLHVEESHKYRHREIRELAAETGFTVIDEFEDPHGWFQDSLWRVQKGRS